jgi:hypothetical protein
MKRIAMLSVCVLLVASCADGTQGERDGGVEELLQCDDLTEPGEESIQSFVFRSVRDLRDECRGCNASDECSEPLLLRIECGTRISLPTNPVSCNLSLQANFLEELDRFEEEYCEALDGNCREFSVSFPSEPYSMCEAGRCVVKVD